MTVRTPLLNSSESRIFLKPENLQPFGSYKIRGVAHAVRAADSQTLSQGISAASAGNMAQAVAFIAREKGIECRIFVPDTAPEIKKQAIRKLGAKVAELPFQEIWQMVRNPPKEIPGLFIHPVFTPGLLEGYATIADELLSDRPQLNAVVIPFGVGGLTAGVAHRLKQLKPDIQIFACEPETAAPLHASLAAGVSRTVDRQPSFVDAIGTPEVLPQVFELVRPLVTASIKLPLNEIRSAVRDLVIQSKLVCEGASAASFAAARRLSRSDPNQEIACILTGGNLAEHHLQECLAASNTAL